MKNNENFAQFVIPGEEQRRLVELDEMWLQKVLGGMTSSALNSLEVNADE